MQWFAESAAEKTPDKWTFDKFGRSVQKRFAIANDIGKAENERLIWNKNVRQLTEQIRAKRDSIWVYVLKNIYSPLFLGRRKFDVVVGNPPWIAYRYIQDRVYQQEIKKLIHDYDLQSPHEKNLNTHMELATLFFEHCRRVYLQQNGTIAFVMPRSVIIPSKQHRAFHVAGLDASMKVVGKRRQVRQAAGMFINRIDAIAEQILKLPYKDKRG